MSGTRIGEDDTAGTLVPVVQDGLDATVVGDCPSQTAGLVGAEHGADVPAILSAAPFIVRTVSGLWVCSTPTVGFAAALHAFAQRAAAGQVDGGQFTVDPRDGLGRVLWVCFFLHFGLASVSVCQVVYR